MCEEVIERLRQVVFLQYVCLSEPEKAEQQFKHLFGRPSFTERKAVFAGSAFNNLSLTRNLLLNLLVTWLTPYTLD